MSNGTSHHLIIFERQGLNKVKQELVQELADSINDVNLIDVQDKEDPNNNSGHYLKEITIYGSLLIINERNDRRYVMNKLNSPRGIAYGAYPLSRQGGHYVSRILRDQIAKNACMLLTRYSGETLSMDTRIKMFDLGDTAVNYGDLFTVGRECAEKALCEVYGTLGAIDKQVYETLSPLLDELMIKTANVMYGDAYTLDDYNTVCRSAGFVTALLKESRTQAKLYLHLIRHKAILQITRQNKMFYDVGQSANDLRRLLNATGLHEKDIDWLYNASPYIQDRLVQLAWHPLHFARVTHFFARLLDGDTIPDPMFRHLLPMLYTNDFEHIELNPYYLNILKGLAKDTVKLSAEDWDNMSNQIGKIHAWWRSHTDDPGFKKPPSLNQLKKQVTQQEARYNNLQSPQSAAQAGA